MLTVVRAALPRVAFDGLLNLMLNDSVGSLVASSFIKIVKLFDDSPAANVSVPAAAV
jgi:hypothetical protein